MTLHPYCLLHMGFIVCTLRKGGLSDHSLSLHHLRACICWFPPPPITFDSHTQFQPHITTVGKPIKRSFLQKRKPSREKRSSFPSPERQITLLDIREPTEDASAAVTQVHGTWGSTGLAAQHAALSYDRYIHQGTGLVNLKITCRGQTLHGVKQAVLSAMLTDTVEESLFPLQSGPCLHWIHVHPEDGSQLLSFMQFYC